MSPIQIMTLCLRLLAVVGIFFAVRAVGSLLVAPPLDDDVRSWLVLVSAYALQLAGCALLWFFPATIARRLVPSLDPSREVSSAGFEQWRRLAMFSVGVWSLTMALPDLVFYVGLYAFAGDIAFTHAPEHWAGIVSTLLQSAIGVWLLFGADSLANLVFRARTAGLSQADGQP